MGRVAVRISALLALIACFLIRPTDSAGQCIDRGSQMRTVGSIPIDTEYFVLEGDYLYVAPDYGSGGFQVVDVSVPSSPTIIGSTTIGFCEDLAYADGFVYATGGDDGLAVIDVRSPSTPTLRGSAQTPIPGEGSYISVAGDRAYVVDSSYQLSAFSITDPDSPQLLGSVTLPDRGDDFCISNGRAYIPVVDHGVVLVDITDPTAMSISWTVPGSKEARGIAASDGTVYVATRNLSDYSSWLWILDPDDPATPTIISALEVRDALGIAAQNDIVYVGSMEGILAVDARDPHNPEVIGSHGDRFWAISVSGQTACFAPNAGSLDLVALGNSTGPFIAGSFEWPGADDMAVDGNYGLLSSYSSGLAVFDRTDPRNPEVLGTYNGPENTYGVAASQGIAFLAEGNTLSSLSYAGGGDPIVLDSVVTPGYARGVAVEGKYVFVADGQPTLSVFEASPEGLLSFVTSLTLATYGEIVVLDRGRAYVHGYDTIEIIDITDPTAPVQLGTSPAGPYPVPFDVNADHLYVPFNTDFVIYDASDPTAVSEIGRIAGAWEYADGASVSNNVAYIYQHRERVLAYDVSDPTAPVLLNRLHNEPNDAPTACWAYDDLVYICSFFDVSIVQSYCAPVGSSLHVPSEYPTIQAAVNAAGPGDEVVIACGTYSEHDIVVSKGVTIRSETGDPGCVTVNAQGAGRGFDVASSEPVWLQGVAVSSGSTDRDGGGLRAVDSELYLQNCVVTSSVAERGGGLAAMGRSIVLVQDSELSENSVTGVIPYGGAVYVSDETQISIVRSDIRSNEALQGGAVMADGSSLMIDQCVFTGNGAYDQAAIFAAVDVLSIRGSVFVGNGPTAGNPVPEEMIGVFPPTGGPAAQVISECTFIGNQVGIGGSIISFHIDGSPNSYMYGGTIESCLFVDNAGQTVDWSRDDWTITLTCNDAYGNTGGDWTGDLASYLGTDGNISADPLFCDPAGGDFQVDYSSPCLDPALACGGKIGALGGGCGLVTPPQNVTVSYEPGGVLVSWDDSDQVAQLEKRAITSYRIYRSNLLGFTPGPETLVHETDTSPWMDGGGEVGDFYMVSAVDANGSESVAVGPQSATGVTNPVVHVGALYQNTPNPFNPSTLISFVLPKAGHAHLGIFDIRGRLVTTLVDDHLEAGPGEVHWNGRDSSGGRVSSGVYFYRLTGPEFQQIRKMLLLK